MALMENCHTPRSLWVTVNVVFFMLRAKGNLKPAYSNLLTQVNKMRVDTKQLNCLFKSNHKSFLVFCLTFPDWWRQNTISVLQLIEIMACKSNENAQNL